MLLGRLLRAYLLGRLLSRGRRGYRGRGYYGYGRQRRGGFRFVGPFPTYSTRTRRGSRVSVSGCCLPIPLALTAATALAARVLMRR